MSQIQERHNQRDVQEVQLAADLNYKPHYNWLDGSSMPHKIDPSFRKEKEFSGIELSDETLELLKDSFYKYLPRDEPGGAMVELKLDPSHLQGVYEKLGLDVEIPSLYAMVCWMAQIKKESGNADGITFDEFMQQAIFFFSQRHH